MEVYAEVFRQLRELEVESSLLEIEGSGGKEDERGREKARIDRRLREMHRQAEAIRGEIDEYESRIYRLVSIDRLSTEEILNAARQHFGSMRDKRFTEDLVEVLAAMGHPPGGTVKLVLVDQETGKKRVVSRAPMTHENRREVYRKYNSGKGIPR